MSLLSSMPLYFKTVLISFCLLINLVAILIYSLCNFLLFPSLDFVPTNFECRCPAFNFSSGGNHLQHILKNIFKGSFIVFFSKLKCTCLKVLILEMYHLDMLLQVSVVQ